MWREGKRICFADSRQRRAANRQPPPVFKVGDTVAVYHGPTYLKMIWAWHPGYQIVEALPNDTYLVQDSASAEAPFRRHARHLIAFPDGNDDLLARLPNRNAEYYPEAILAEDTDLETVLVRWRGYDADADSWEPVAALAGTPAYLKWSQVPRAAVRA